MSDLTNLLEFLARKSLRYRFKDFPKDFAQTILIQAPSPLVDGSGTIELDFDLSGNFIQLQIKPSFD